MSHREYNHAVQPLAGKQIVTGILVLRGSMQVTKGTWHMREQCIPGSLSSSPAQKPARGGGGGNEAIHATRPFADTG